MIVHCRVQSPRLGNLFESRLVPTPDREYELNDTSAEDIIVPVSKVSKPNFPSVDQASIHGVSYKSGQQVFSNRNRLQPR